MSDLSTRVEQDVLALKTELGEIRGVIEKIAGAVSKLVLVEERQQTQLELAQRMMARIEGVEMRQNALDIQRAREEGFPSRLALVETTVVQLREELLTRKVTRQTLGGTAKILWMILGSGITNVLIFLFNEFAARG